MFFLILVARSQILHTMWVRSTGGLSKINPTGWTGTKAQRFSGEQPQRSHLRLQSRSRSVPHLTSLPLPWAAAPPAWTVWFASPVCARSLWLTALPTVAGGLWSRQCSGRRAEWAPRYPGSPRRAARPPGTPPRPPRQETPERVHWICSASPTRRGCWGCSAGKCSRCWTACWLSWSAPSENKSSRWLERQEEEKPCFPTARLCEMVFVCE